MSNDAAAGLSSTVATDPSARSASASWAIAVGHRDGLVHRAGAGRPGQARLRGTGPPASGRSPRSGRRRGPSRRPPSASSARSTPLSRPPAISTTGPGNARRAAMTASGWVPCESLTNRTPSTRPTVWSRCSTPVNAAAARRTASGATPNSSPTAIAARAFETLCRPGIPSSSTGMIPPPGPACAVPPPAIGSRSTAADTIQPSTTPRPPGHRAVVAVQDHRRGAQPRVAAHDRILEVEDERAVRIDHLREASLDAPVGLHRAVPVEVVGRDVGVHGNRRPARERRQLQLRQLDHDAVVRRQLRQALDQGQCRCCRRGSPGGSGPRRGSRAPATRSWSCPSSR